MKQRTVASYIVIMYLCGISIAEVPFNMQLQDQDIHK